MGEFELWLTWGVRVILALLVADYLRMRLTMSEKYVLKEDCRLEQERVTSQISSFAASYKEDCTRIEKKIDNVTDKIITLSRGLDKLNGRNN